MNKIIFLTLLFCGLAFSAQSQSLTYSRVLLVETLDTVPQGKVWKVVSYYSSEGASATIKCEINGNKQILFSKHYDNGSMIKREIILPMWLPAGTTLKPSDYCNGLSIIEFTESNF